MPVKPFGVIFDWDGVIIDSSRQHEKAWQQLAAEEKHTLAKDFFLRSFGMKNENVIPNLLGWTNDPAEIQGLSLRKEEIYREILCRDAVSPLPGVLHLLEALTAQAVPCAIASSTPLANIECVIDRLGIRRHFRAMVTGEDVKHGKPDPEVFLLAGGKLGLAPAKCVVIEDAHVGIEAAQMAQMKVVAVATTHPAATLADADVVVNWLSELTVDTLEKLAS